MIRITIVLAILASLGLMGCREQASASTARREVPAAGQASGPRQTVARMLELAEAGDWAAYIDDFYGETHKFRDDGDRRKLIERYENKWGNRVVEMLRPVSRLEPTVSDDGSQAIFEMGDGRQFILHRDDAGVWKFHL